MPLVDKDEIKTIYNSFIAVLENQGDRKEAINIFKQGIETLGALHTLNSESDCTESAEIACSEYSDPISFSACFAASYAGCITVDNNEKAYILLWRNVMFFLKRTFL